MPSFNCKAQPTNGGKLRDACKPELSIYDTYSTNTSVLFSVFCDSCSAKELIVLFPDFLLINAALSTVFQIFVEFC